MTRMTIAAFPIVELTAGASLGSLISTIYKNLRGQLTHSDYIACYRIAKRQIPCYGYKDVNEAGKTNACQHNARSAKVRIVTDLIQY